MNLLASLLVGCIAFAVGPVDISSLPTNSNVICRSDAVIKSDDGITHNGVTAPTLDMKNVPDGTIIHSKDKVYTIVIDDDAPEITIEGIENSKYYNKPNIEVKVQDEHLKSKEFFMDDDKYDKDKDLKDGKHVFTVKAVDEAGNRTTKTVKFTTDTVDPVIKVSGVKDGGFYKSANIDVSITDTNIDKIDITLDGKTVGSEIKVTEQGKHTLIVTAIDKAGNKTEKKIDFTVHTDAPKITLSGIEKSLTNQDVFAKCEVTSGIKCDTTIVLTRNGEIIPATAMINGGLRLSDEGKYELKISAIDIVGNKSEKSAKFTIDKTPPSLKVSGIDKDFFDSDVNFSIDTDGDLSVKINGQNVSLNKDGIYGALTKEGFYTIEVASSDAAGNIASFRKSFTIDKTFPTAKFNDIKNVNDLRKVIFSAEDNNLRDIKLEASLGDDNASIENRYVVNGPGPEISLSSDHNSNTDSEKWIFIGSAFDSSGNTTILKKEIIRDTMAPRITISQPKKHINKNYAITAKIEDAHRQNTEITIDRDGKKTVLNRGEAENIKEVVTKEGNYTVTIKSTDESGNESTSEVSFEIDKTPPIVKIDAPKGHNKVVKQVTAKSNEEGKVLLSITRDGKNIYKGKAPYTNFNKDGEYKATAYAIDLAGNKSKKKTAKFIVDHTAPVLTINGIKEGSYSKNAVTLSVNCNERFYKTNKVNVVINKGNRAFKNTGKSSTNKYTLNKAGEYTVIVNAVDKAGNKAKTKKLHFYIDREAPIVTIHTPTKSGFDAVIAPSITIKDEYFANKTISITNGNGLKFKDSFGTKGGTRSYSDFEKLRSRDGEYTITVKATDKAGNITTKTSSFVVNRYGSTFKTLEKPSAYGKEADRDVVIREKNLSGIKDYTCEVSLDSERTDAEGVQVSKKGYNTTYRIPKSNFANDGVYKVFLTTKDKTGNTSKSKGDFSFTIDKTPPVIKYQGAESNKVYKQKTVKLYVGATDTLSKKTEVNVTINERPAKITKEPDGSYVEIPSGYNQNIKITATDQAGNTATQDLEKVSVSTSIFGPLVAHKGLTAGIIVIIGVIAVGVTLFFKKRGNKDEETGEDDIVL